MEKEKKTESKITETKTINTSQLGSQREKQNWNRMETESFADNLSLTIFRKVISISLSRLFASHNWTR